MIFNDLQNTVTFGLQMENKIDLKNKYHSLKEKYNKLLNLRIDSMKDNVEDLKRKIEEHKRIHEIATKELRKQNKELMEIEKEVSIAKDDLKELEETNRTIIEQLKEQDEAFEVLLEYSEFKVHCKGVGTFQISYGDGDVFSFLLSRRNENEYKYQPINIPNNIDEAYSFISKSITFSSKDFKNFYFQIHSFCMKLLL